MTITNVTATPDTAALGAQKLNGLSTTQTLSPAKVNSTNEEQGAQEAGEISEAGEGGASQATSKLNVLA